MANDQRTAGFMQALGISDALKRPQQEQIRGGGEAAAFMNLGRTAGRGPATQLLAGLAGGVGGLVTGEGGRGFREFGRDFQAGFNDFNDGNQARDMGISVETLRNRRALAEELKTISVGSGSLEEQINAAEEVARKANSFGDIEVAMQAATMRAQLEKQLEQQKQAGIATEQADIQLNEALGTESIGIEASLVGQDGLGKAVRIDAERAEQMGLQPSDIGRFVFIDENGARSIVDGVDLVPKDSLFSKFGVGGIAPKDDNIIALARANGATAGNIPKLRNVLVDAGKNAAILNDVSTLLTNMASPEQALDLTGKAAIGINRVVRFADNAANILAEADGGAGASQGLGAYEWDGQVVQGPAEQRAQFVQTGKSNLLDRLNNLASESGLPAGDNLADFLPTGVMAKLRSRGASLEQIALVSEQYWSNVMELAYMDARLQEPSNRGLSDKDIDNALRRIGAATANPASFAQRQLTLLNRLSNAVQDLGSTIRVPAGSRTARSSVVDFVYAPDVRRDVLKGIEGARESLLDLAQTGTPQAAPLDANKPALTARQRAEALPGFPDLPPDQQQLLIELEEAEDGNSAGTP